MKKRNILLVLILSILVVSTTAFGWFLYISSKKVDGIIKVDGSSASADVQLYIGLDFDRNGELDPWIDGGAEVNKDERAMAAYLENCFNIVEKEEDLDFTNLFAGKTFTYVVKVDNIGEKSTYIDLSYVYNSIENLGKIAYQIKNLNLLMFEDQTSFNETPLASVSKVEKTINKNYNLYELSKGYNFVNKVKLDKGQSLCIEYQLETLNYNQMHDFSVNMSKNIVQDYYLHHVNPIAELYGYDLSSISDLLNQDTINVTLLSEAITTLKTTLTGSDSSTIFTHLDSMMKYLGDGYFLEEQKEIDEHLQDYLDGKDLKLVIDYLLITVNE